MTTATLRSAKHELRLWYGLMFVTGFCSMIYELSLAQLLTGIMGNALARFATTLGVYVVAMGIGSVLFKPVDDRRDGLLFFRAEIALFLVGLLSPFLLIGFHHFATVVTDDEGVRSTIVLWSTHAIIFATGFLSGFELPILSALASRRSDEGDSSVLASDYIGMFLASLVFPIVLFPWVGLVPAFWIATALNLLAAATTYRLIGGTSKFAFATVSAFALINASGLIYATNIQDWLSLLYASGS